MIERLGTCTRDTEHLILRQLSYDDGDAMLRNWVAIGIFSR